jgi:mannose-6-phosphate isomerase-like protein (cupin superfamily)
MSDGAGGSSAGDGRDERDAVDAGPAGKRVSFRETAADTDGEYLRFDMWLEPAAYSTGPISHVHPNQEESLEVLDGRLGVTHDGEERVLEAGERAVVPAGEPHKFENAGDSELHLLGEVRPALRTEEFMRVTYGLAADGYATESAIPYNPLRTAALVDEYDDMLYLAALPPWVQRLGVRLVGPVARELGYHRLHAKYR